MENIGLTKINNSNPNLPNISEIHHNLTIKNLLLQHHTNKDKLKVKNNLKKRQVTLGTT